MHQTQWSPERPLPPPVSLTSQSHHEKPPEVTCTSRGNPVLYQSGKLPEAAERIRASIAVDAASPDAWSNLALVLDAAGRADAAVNALIEAARLGFVDATLELDDHVERHPVLVPAPGV